MPINHQDVHNFLHRKVAQFSGHPVRAARGHALLVIIGRNRAVSAKESQDAQVAQQEQQEQPQ